MATQHGRGERKRPIIVLGLTTPWAAVETAETAVLADITPILTILLTVEAVLQVVLEVVLEAVVGVAVLLQPVAEDVAHVVPGVAGGDAEALEVLPEVPVGVAPVLAAGRAGLAGAVPAHSRRMTIRMSRMPKKKFEPRFEILVCPDSSQRLKTSL